MMTIELRIVCQNFARRQAVRRAAESAGLTRQQYRREADAVAAECFAQFGPVFFGSYKMATGRFESAHFRGHALAQGGRPGTESDHHGFRVFAEETEDPALEPLLHSTDLMPRSTAQAASGVNAVKVVTGV